MSTTLDSEEERVIEAGKEERQRVGSSVLDIRILPSPNERHMG